MKPLEHKVRGCSESSESSRALGVLVGMVTLRRPPQRLARWIDSSHLDRGFTISFKSIVECLSGLEEGGLNF